MSTNGNGEPPHGGESCASPSSYLGLPRAVSPRTTPKTVSISNHTETISPLILGEQKEEGAEGRPKQRPSIKSPAATHRLSGRLPFSTCGPTITSASASSAAPSSSSHLPTTTMEEKDDQIERLTSVLEQVHAWTEKAQQQRLNRKLLKRQYAMNDFLALQQSTDGSHEAARPTSYEEEVDLDELKDILTAAPGLSRRRKASTMSLRRKLSVKSLQRKASGSDTDHPDYEALVPAAHAVLDNSKTLAYNAGGVSDESESSDTELHRSKSHRDLDAWSKFKFEILRIIQTLQLKGWKKVPLSMSQSITVQRLSGALTNAVYVVEPPSKLPPKPEDEVDGVPKPRRPPPKLLLRIYGPQVEHLIDRETELAILRRLARQRIGPRMLGTFDNGRFEEYFHAQTLTPKDLRNPDTSRQIAKRMRELHEGIELLEQERDDGPFVWRNWDKWYERLTQVVSWLDERIKELPAGYKPTGDELWKRRGFIFGVPLQQFCDVFTQYREWLNNKYGGPEKMKNELVFAHNDTQYGNILRLIPSGESPLLLPANTHKQLVVIDFEYSNANMPGLEFANHFTEWCYDYHDEKKPYACNTERYPTLEEQERFIRAYVRHRPNINISSPKMEAQSPGLPSRKSTASISQFMLDARAPPSSSENLRQTSDEAAAKASEDKEVNRLLEETRYWRLANSAQWVAWGIIQAKVPGMPDFEHDKNLQEPAVPSDESSAEAEARSDLGERADLYREIVGGQPTAPAPEEKEQVEEEEFDYLGYAQHRAMFFWGDAVQLGFVNEKDLPEDVREKMKSVPY